MNREYLAQEVNVLIRLVGQNLDITESEMMQIANLYPLWEADRSYAEGTILRHGVNSDGEAQLWRVVQAHTSQADWQPGVAASLFVAIGFTDSGIPIWTQPHGAHDAYMEGDKVSHNGQIWISDTDGNVWSPGVHGWSLVNG
jgi:hypothetical protein